MALGKMPGEEPAVLVLVRVEGVAKASRSGKLNGHFREPANARGDGVKPFAASLERGQRESHRPMDERSRASLIEEHSHREVIFCS